MAASELEFYLYRDSYRTANAKGYDRSRVGRLVRRGLPPPPGGPGRGLRRGGPPGLVASEIPIENSKGEAAIGQHELNVRYADALTMADRHSVLKHGLKELADAQGVSVTFMAKPDGAQPGNSCHIHLSLWAAGDDPVNGRGTNVFAAAEHDGDVGDGRWAGGRMCSGGSSGGGWHHAADLMVFYAPTINSYKRYQSSVVGPDPGRPGRPTTAPSGSGWSGRVRSLRIENRIPGADVNPHLAYAATLASRARRDPQPDRAAARVPVGDGYGAGGGPTARHRCRPADQPGGGRPSRLAASGEARRLLGDEVVDHYVHHFRAEVAASRRAVTDWEKRRYFERI